VSEERQTVELPDFSDLAPQQIGPVQVGKMRIVIKEASADADCRYRGALARGTKYNVTGKEAEASGRQFEAELLLLSLTCFELYEHKGQALERPVPIQVIKTWPARVTHWLFEQADRMRPKDEETPEQLEARRAEIDLRLREARRAERNGDDPDPFAGSPDGTTPASPSATG
jgi:hypothetical protein